MRPALPFKLRGTRPLPSRRFRLSAPSGVGIAKSWSVADAAVGHQQRGRRKDAEGRRRRGRHSNSCCCNFDGGTNNSKSLLFCKAAGSVPHLHHHAPISNLSPSLKMSPRVAAELVEKFEGDDTNTRPFPRAVVGCRPPAAWASRRRGRSVGCHQCCVAKTWRVAHVEDDIAATAVVAISMEPISTGTNKVSPFYFCKAAAPAPHLHHGRRH